MKFKNLSDVVVHQNEVHIYLKNGLQTTIITVPTKEAIKLKKYLKEIL
ncbi:hypothetical protein [Vibrio parahaemolyticus]|nr:hypothetical protein [Vibrio parahaemolyticus]